MTYIGFIYCAISPSNKKYYGKTLKTIDDVKKRHYNRSLNHIYRLSSAIKKYGFNNLNWKIIETIESNDKKDLNKKLNEREKYWIEKDKTYLKEYGYNMTMGGDGGDTLSNHPKIKEIRKKQADKNRGKKRSKEFKNNLSKKQKENFGRMDPQLLKERAKKIKESRKKRIELEGFTEKELNAIKINTKRLIEYNKSEEGRKRVSEQFKGKPKKPFSDEHKKNIGKASKGRKIPGKKVIINNKTYESLHDASRKLQVPLNTLRNRLLSKNFSEWNYYE